MVAGSLAMIGVLQLVIGPDVLFGDTIQRQQVAIFDDCKANGFLEPQCAKWLDEMQLQECRENKDVDSSECRVIRMYLALRLKQLGLNQSLNLSLKISFCF